MSSILNGIYKQSHLLRQKRNLRWQKAVGWRLSKPIKSSSTGFQDIISFADDLSDLSNIYQDFLNCLYRLCILYYRLLKILLLFYLLFISKTCVTLKFVLNFFRSFVTFFYKTRVFFMKFICLTKNPLPQSIAHLKVMCPGRFYKV